MLFLFLKWSKQYEGQTIYFFFSAKSKKVSWLHIKGMMM